jgi:hypothetical protein
LITFASSLPNSVVFERTPAFFQFWKAEGQTKKEGRGKLRNFSGCSVRLFCVGDDL